MNKLDLDYQNLLRDILNNGVEKSDRTGTGTISVFGRQIRHKMSDGFPTLTTKKLAFKTMVTELLYFLSGETSIKYLVDNECHIWNGDLSKHHGVDITEYINITKIDSNLYEGGALYPHQWRNFGSNKYNRKKITIPFKTSFTEKKPNINSNDKNVGKKFSTLEYGDYIIIDSLKQGKRKETYYEIQFIDTNTLKNIRRDKLGTNVIDPYKPSKNGVACMGGYQKYSHLDIEKFKNIWNGMISRCYNVSNENYKYYGGRGVYVENRWLCFEYFLSDVDKIKNWDDKLKNWDDYDLDKDIYGDGFKYSLETCCWLSKSDNTKKSKEKFSYKVTNGVDEYEFINHVEFINKIKINNQGNFASMLRGERQNCEGWTLVSKTKITDGIDQIKELLNTLKTNPDSRRMLVTAWNPSQLHDLCLPACHYSFQVWTRELSLEERFELFKKQNNGSHPEDIELIDDYNVPKRAISLMFNMRSTDVPLGLPFNIASYGLLLIFLGNMTNMIPDELIASLGDTHIYKNQIEGIKEQLSRQPMELPILEISDEVNFSGTIDDFLNSCTKDSFKLLNYNPHPAIKIPLSN
jgi:thymidylate synthase